MKKIDMHGWLQRLRVLVFFNPWVKWSALPLAALALVGTVMSTQAPPATPLVALAAEPLYALGARAKPTLTLALSVEFPTVGAQYLNATYAPTDQYVGYFDSESCYVYVDSPTESIPTGKTLADYKRFDWYKVATNRTCGGDSYSGNFMNWATSSAIDILRFGLTGGDRVIDTSTLTVLQRAVLPTNAGSFWNGSNFPSKQLAANQVAGALPTAILGSYSGIVYVANCLNRVHFGTAATGNCNSPGANSNLGTQGASIAPPLTSDFTYCAAENGTCTFSGTKQIAYGADTAAGGAANSGAYNSTIATGSVTCSNAVFGDPLSGTVKKCYYRDVPTTQSNFSTDGFFYSRVSVCAANSTNLLDTRTSLCTRYPSGNFKPTGNLQKYSDRLRVAAFGYLNDNSNSPQRYGGVLRAPMKYVGPTTYDANFSLVSGTNPAAEWDTSTGIFVQNPDGNSTVASGPSYNGPYLSGVTTYLNQFGRTGAFGSYKTYDPVSELYYESLRYLQGLTPTAQAISGLPSSTLSDGFPVSTTWVDPHPPNTSSSATYSCVRNNILTIGDIHTHNDSSIPGNTNRTTSDFIRAADVTKNEPDFHYWTNIVGAFEAATTPGLTYTDGQNVSRTTNNLANPTPISALAGLGDMYTPSGDGASYYIAGVAYWAATHDIRGTDWTSPDTSGQRPGMRVKTYMLDVNEYGESSNATNRHQNQFFLAAKYGGFTDASLTGNPFKPSASATAPGTNTNWQDPANLGEAQTYYLSSSAQAVLDGLNEIFASVAAQANSIAGGAISTQRLTTVAGSIYQAQFDPSSWAGDVTASGVGTDSNGNTVLLTDAAHTWHAAAELDAKASATALGGDNRNIVIGNANPGTATASDFRWASLPATAQAALMATPYGTPGASDSATIGEARLNYLRGDRTNESPNGQLMRSRTSVMGDVVNSAVVFSGAPSTTITDSGYAAFATANASRTHAIFVGANDGMLHAFDADHGTLTGTGHGGGNELFAYIPSWLIPRLGLLTSTHYVHQSYVDGSQSVGEALVGSNWKTVLVGATGGGGQGVYALDVTDPSAFSASKVMWEFTDADDADLGNVVGRPQILKIRTNAPTATAATYKYFAVFASGVNNYANDSHYSSTGNPALFILDLSKGVGQAWSLGSNYYKVNFPAGTATASGMIGFTARLDAVNSVTAVYAGDLQGNLWKLSIPNLTGGISDLGVGTLAALNEVSYYKNGSGTATPMYIAKSGSSVVQPISMEPALVYGENRNIIVAFGTGKFLEVGDNMITNAPQQSVYAVLDNLSATLDSGTSSVSAIAGRGRLQAGTVSTSGGTVTVPAFNWGRPLTDGDTTMRSGWYFDFGNAGERQVSEFAVVLGRVVFGSVIPAQNSCDNGNGNLYIAQIATGNSTIVPSNVGILGQPYVLATGSSSSTTDATGLRKTTTTYQIILQGSAGTSTTTTSAGGANALSQAWDAYTGRLSWREISNYQQLRHQ